MTRPRDTLHVELVESTSAADNKPGAGSVFDRFTSVQITNDMSAPSEAVFELGDDGSWRDLSRYVSHGTKYKVFVNGRPRLTGRVEMNDLPTDAAAGSVVRFAVRTKLQDAWFTSASESVRVKGATLEEFLYQLYEPLGFVKSDFVLRASLARDLMTGKSSANKGTDASLEPIKLDVAKVKPPESIYEAADRHLRRHGLMHWDSPDGKIVVGAPNDEQDPLYFLIQSRSNQGVLNNTLGMTRTQDWSGIPTALGIYGIGGGRGTSRSRVSYVVEDNDLINAGFYRPVKIVAESIRSQALAERAAKRELSARSKMKDSFDVESDGLSWWNGRQNIPWGIDTVAEMSSDVAGGRVGAYYVYRVISRRDASSGDVTNLSLVKKGIWKL